MLTPQPLAGRGRWEDPACRAAATSIERSRWEGGRTEEPLPWSGLGAFPPRFWNGLASPLPPGTRLSRIMSAAPESQASPAEGPPRPVLPETRHSEVCAHPCVLVPSPPVRPPRRALWPCWPLPRPRPLRPRVQSQLGGGPWRLGPSFSEPISQGNSPHPRWAAAATLRGPPRDPHSCCADPLLGAPQPSVTAPHGWPPPGPPHQTQLPEDRVWHLRLPTFHAPRSRPGTQRLRAWGGGWGASGGGAEPSGCSLLPVSPTSSIPHSQHFLS